MCVIIIRYINYAFIINFILISFADKFDPSDFKPRGAKPTASANSTSNCDAGPQGNKPSEASGPKQTGPEKPSTNGNGKALNHTSGAVGVEEAETSTPTRVKRSVREPHMSSSLRHFNMKVRLIFCTWW